MPDPRVLRSDAAFDDATRNPLRSDLGGGLPSALGVIAALVATLLLPSGLEAQEEARPVMDNPVAPTPAAARLAAVERRTELEDASLVRNIPFRNVGPTVMSGRVVDIDVSPDDPTRFYVAYASGGLWRTDSNGTDFTPLFDDQAVMTIGDIAVDWARGGTIWVGTGENNSSRSSYAGTGLYRSADGGATWEHAGLAETHRIGRIVLHPDDPDVLWVAALGSLYSPSEERGVYRSADGGATWERTLFVDESTGAIDLLLDPTDPDVLYASTWHRERRAWNFVESGPGSAVWKSTDGGVTWTRLTTEGSGFPTGEGVGRIGLALHGGGPGVLYAFLDNQERRPEEDDEESFALTRDMIRELSTREFLEVGEDALEEYLERNGFPAAYTAQSILAMVRSGELEPVALVEYLEDANAQLFDTPVVGGEVYRSDDGGATWQRTHEGYLDDLYYSYGYYFGEVRVAPDDPERIYVMGVPILRSDDGGATFHSINEENVHVDHHALWVSPTRPGHLVNGNDGGINISWDDGASWFKANTPSVGQFYAIQVDQAEPYRVYGGLQDNGVWVGPSGYEHDYAWYAEGDYPYDRLLGGDGMQVEVDPRTDDVVYTGFQFGNYFRIERATGRRAAIQPDHELGERPLRFNWMTPIHLSRHNPDILYLGSNKLHRSMNRGDDWEALSGDLTRGGEAGDVPYGTLTTIDESPLRFGLLYVGSDDGLVHVSRDAGHTWTRISDGLPEHLWVSRVEASAHHEGLVFVTLNGYRWDHFVPYLYRSDDYGQSWERLGADLPAEPLNVVTEDPSSPDILYVGSDHGLYVSLDGGASFMTMMGGMPNAPVHDVKVQDREEDLVVGTHGRSIWIADLEHVRQLTPELVARAVHLFDLADVRWRDGWGSRPNAWSDVATPELEIAFHAGGAGTATVRVLADDGTEVASWTDEAERGLNYAAWDLAVDPERVEAYRDARGEPADEDAPTVEEADDGAVYLLPGTYTVEVVAGGETTTGTFTVEAPREGSRRGGEPGAYPEEYREGR